ncbi:sensor histidine kinase [Carnobacterium sp.]|uniref:sensor histidine kinase n=1 Tax=Carnobacterium sp. TaxID=48221 RepID=UPI003C7467A8
MKKKFGIVFSQGSLMNRLLRNYAFFMILLTTLATLLISWIIYEQNRNQAEATIQEAAQSTTRMLNDKRASSRIILDQLSGSFDKTENITAYLTKPIDEYLSYIYTRQSDSDDFSLFSRELKSVYATYDDLSSLYISLNRFPEYLESTVQKKEGSIKQGTPRLAEGAFYIVMPMTQGSMNGNMFLGFKESDFAESLESLNSFDGLSVYLISGLSNRLYTYHDDGLSKPKQEKQELLFSNELQAGSQLPTKQLNKDYYFSTQKISSEYRVLVTLDKSAVLKQSFIDIQPLLLGVLLLDALLLFLLIRTFKRYSYQLEIVTDVLDRASDGNWSTRIDTQKTEFELRELSQGINHMLENIEQYVNDIYKLEIKQQDAHMRALQAQINPHFLYNTLEYIRMSALSEGNEELSDVVYAFSTLLRNNISSEKVTTLKDELDFCEKYAYLYQMRYPSRIAYHIKIEEGLENFVIPKFVIQPLIENYFKHGINFTRKNNVISVKAYMNEDKVQIEIKDNGKGMTLEKLTTIQERLETRYVHLNESIGLQNVNERMQGFYGENYHMKLSINETGGLTIMLSLEKGINLVQSTIS